MKTKDTIAVWILVLFALKTGAEPFFEFLDSLKMHRPFSEILWLGVMSLVFGASGVFLIFHFWGMTDDLARYEFEEQERMKKLEQRNDEH